MVAQIAHRIMVLRHGKMVEVGERRPDPAGAARGIHAPRWSTSASRATHFRRWTSDAARDADAAASTNVERRLSPRCRKVIDDVSLEVARGDTLAVVGESGSGKISLARVVVGLLPRQRRRRPLQRRDPAAGD